MNAIVNVDSDWGIGKNGDLLFPIPEDLQYFKKMTTGKVVVLGRQTLLSFPGGKPLPNRTNIVLTTNTNAVIEGVTLCHNFTQLDELLQQYPPNDVLLIGGDFLYSQLIDCCHFSYVTKVASNGNGTHFFPNLDKKPNWTLLEETKPHLYKELSFTYCTYKNASPVAVSSIV